MKVLQIEVTNFCNGKCIFCVNSKLKNKGTMSMKLFRKILIDAQEMEDLEQIIPMLTGEPFMDKKFLKRLKLINKIHPTKIIKVFTNGSFLRPEVIESLSEIKNLKMYFSINGACKETRKRIMGLDDYEHVIKMILLYEKTGKPFRTTIVSYPSIKQREIDEFSKIWDKNALIISYKNFAGKLFNYKPKTGCNRAINHMTVLFDGRVNLCCMDAFGEMIFGDLRKQTVKEVWNSPARQAYINAHLRCKPWKGLCANCTGA